jgi:hypothetical protein
MDVPVDILSLWGGIKVGWFGPGIRAPATPSEPCSLKSLHWSDLSLRAAYKPIKGEVPPCGLIVPWSTLGK